MNNRKRKGSKILIIIFTALALTISAKAIAQEETVDGDTAEVYEFELDPIVVEGRRPITAYSDDVIRERDFMNFPRQNPSDLVRLVPGIHINQHTGGGKAHQYFLRGFDAEHGQDLAGYFNGIPLNEVSQMHGQGYLDLFFLIPETLSAINVIKGPYDPQYGNFAVAGAINFVPRAMPEYNQVKATYGSFNTYRVLGQGGAEVMGTSLHLAADWESTEGFTDPGDYEAGRLFAMATRPVGTYGTISLLATHYDSEYDAADVVPVKWIALDRIDRYDAIDDTDGGESIRTILGVTYEYDSGERTAGARVWYQDRKTVIFSNYTYYLLNPVRGDQYELYDERYFYGAEAWAGAMVEVAGIETETEVGISFRSDEVEQAQYNTDDRKRFNTLSDYDFTESSAGVYIKEFIRPDRRLQIMLGGRYDRVWYNIEGTQDVMGPVQTFDNVPVDTVTWAEVASPKASIVYSPVMDREGIFNGLDIFANYGIGFYTNRALEKAFPPSDNDIPRAESYEVAARASMFDGKLSLAAGLWWANKEQELVFTPESGISIPRGESERRGLDVEARLQPTPWLYLATDFFLTEAEFDDGEDIPGTPEVLLTQVASIQHSSGFHGSARVRYEGERPLLNGDESRPYWIMDVLAAYDTDRWGVELAVDNVFNREWDDTSFSYTSRPSPMSLTYTGVHITPGTPLAARLSASIKF